MSECKLYYNAGCSKSRAALEWLKNHEIDVKVVEYIKNPPSIEDLVSICEKLGMKPSEIIRYSNPIAKELCLIEKEKIEDDDYFYGLMHQIPLLLERPICVRGNKAAVGRPLENIIALFEDKVNGD